MQGGVPRSKNGKYLAYRVKSGDATVIGKGVAFSDNTTDVRTEVTATVTAESGLCAGIPIEVVSATESALSGGTRVTLQVAGVAKFICQAAIAVGVLLVFGSTGGDFKTMPTTAATRFVSHGVCLGKPDTAADASHMMLHLNVPDTYPAA